MAPGRGSRGCSSAETFRQRDTTNYTSYVVYELGLQEALAHYAGSDPVHSGTSFMDGYYGFGRYTFELAPGYDCPEHAMYLDSSIYASGAMRTHPSSICLFEFPVDYPA